MKKEPHLCEHQNYLTPKELVARYKGSISERTLANWRSKGEGPDYVKIGGKVLYCMCSVIRWEVRRTVSRTVLRKVVAAILIVSGEVAAAGARTDEIASVMATVPVVTHYEHTTPSRRPLQVARAKVKRIWKG